MRYASSTAVNILRGDVPPGTKIFCPFPDHEDSTPSAVYYPDGHVHCFGCGKHAFDLVDLVRKTEFADEPDGRSLAEAWVYQYGANAMLPQAKSEPRKRETEPLAIMAMTIFASQANTNLAGDTQMVETLCRSRGLTDPVALGLGLTEQWQLNVVRQEMTTLGYGQEAITQALIGAGLVTQTAPHRYYLGRRILIPERRGGQTVFYQARALHATDAPKYLNPRTPKPLYGMETLARETGRVWIGEGAFDVLPLIERGESAVAAMGAELTPTLVDTLVARTGDRPVMIIFDNDDTGAAKGKTLGETLYKRGVKSHLCLPQQPYKDYGEWLSACGPDIVIADTIWSAE